jgi:dTDP-4-amino-4,6-dideoxygalactose transaminase
MSTIPLVDLQAQRAAIQGELTDAINRVVERGSFINGQETRAFESEFAVFSEVPHCIGVSNGTTALELVFGALGIGPGDEVITASHTFMATVGSIVRCGAVPVLVDVDPATWVISAEQVAAAVTPRTRAIVPVHLYGNPADVPAIAAAAPGIPIVEDAAQAHGSRYGGLPVGSTAAAATFSFYPGKTLGAYGDAGAIITTDDALASLLRELRDHGRQGKYEHRIVGTNARMDEIQAAVLRAKLAHLPEWIAARQRIAEAYEAGLAGSGLPVQAIPPDGVNTRHLFVLLHPERDRMLAELKEGGIGAGVHYPIPVHRQPAMAGVEHRVAGGALPVTDELAATCLSLPIYPEMSEGQVDTVIGAVMESAGVSASAR